MSSVNENVMDVSDVKLSVKRDKNILIQIIRRLDNQDSLWPEARIISTSKDSRKLLLVNKNYVCTLKIFWDISVFS